MVKAALAKAASGIAQFIEKKKTPKITERRVLVVFSSETEKKKRKLFVLEENIIPGATSRFKIEKGMKTVLAVQNLLRPALPLFHNTNIDQKFITRNNREHFIHDHIEYDVVRVDIHSMMGIPEGSSSEKELESRGFSIIPLTEHRFQKQLVPLVGRP